jgi:hypothetical protein
MHRQSRVKVKGGIEGEIRGCGGWVGRVRPADCGQNTRGDPA